MNKRLPIALAGLLGLAFVLSLRAAEEPAAKPITGNLREMVEEAQSEP